MTIPRRAPLLALFALALLFPTVIACRSAPVDPPRFDPRPDVWHSTRTGPLRLAIVGLVHQHAEGPLWQAAHRDDVEIVGVCEPDVALFERLAEKHGVDPSLRFDDVETMLRASQPEAVSVMTSIAEHADVVEICARSGVHTLVEKPLAFRVEDAERMAALAREHRVLVLTNYETSWYASVRGAAELVGVGESPRFTKLVFRHGHRGPIEIGCYREFTDWLTDPEQNGGGALVDFGCYGAVLATWMTGGARPERVVAAATTLKPDVYPRVDDDATIVLEYPGATAVIEASWAWTHDNKEMDVYSPEGSVHAGKWDDLAFRERDGAPETLEPPPMPDHLKDEWTYLRHVVRGQCTVDPLSSIELNRVVVEILDEARRQVASGRR